MHKIRLPRAVVDRIVDRCRTLHRLKSLNCRRFAHIVVALQNGFMVPGQPAEIATAREVVPNVNRISQAIRMAGGLAVFIQNTFDAEAVTAWLTYFETSSSPEWCARIIAALSVGSFGHALWDGPDVQPGFGEVAA